MNLTNCFAANHLPLKKQPCYLISDQPLTHSMPAQSAQPSTPTTFLTNLILPVHPYFSFKFVSDHPLPKHSFSQDNNTRHKPRPESRTES